MNYTEEQMDKLYRQERNFAVRVDGIWRFAKGVYLSPAESGRIQVVLNGKFTVIEPGHSLDLQGYSDVQVEREVIRRNLASLPPSPVKKKLVADWTVPIAATRTPRRRTVAVE